MQDPHQHSRLEPLPAVLDSIRHESVDWIAGVVFWGVIWGAFLAQIQVEWSVNPQYQYGWGVPVLAAYLARERWSWRPTVAPGMPPVGWGVRAALVLSAIPLLPLRIIQEANPDWRATVWAWGMLVCAQSLWWFACLGGRKWAAHFAPPVLFMLLCLPWPSLIESPVVQSLTNVVAVVTVECLNWAGIPASRRGHLIELASGVVGIDEACSGVRSFQSMLMAGIFLGELWRLGWRNRLILVGGGLAVAGVLNWIRALALTALSAKYGPEAIHRWHDPAGWGILIVSAGLLWGIGSTLRMKAKHGGVRELQIPRVERRTSVLRRPPGWLLGSLVLWQFAVEGLTELWFVSHERTLVHRGPLTLDWPADEPGFRIQLLPGATRLLLRSDVARSAVWERADGSVWQIYFIQWFPGRVSAQIARVHRPEACLPAVGLTLRAQERPMVWTIEAAGLNVAEYEFEARGQSVRVFYGIWGDRVANQTDAEESFSPIDTRSRLREAWVGRRHHGQQVLEIAVHGASSAEAARNQVREFVAQRLRVTSPGK